MRHYFMPLISAALLAGCATTSTADLRKLPVAETYRTTKPPQEVAQCLAENLTRLGAPSIYQAYDGLAVSFTTEGNTMALFVIGPDGTVTVRRASAILPYREKTAGCV